jgi:lipopolysaccharide transport system permease protein
MIKLLWQYRDFILNSIRNEFKARFARSGLGAFWMIFNPLAQVAIYALIFTNIMSARIADVDNVYSFAIYLSSGILAWSLFNDIITRCLNLFVNNGNLMKKVMFPKVVLPAISVGAAVADNLMLFLSILLIFALLGHSPTVQLLWLPVLTLSVVALAMGIGLILGILNVFIRDIGQAIPIILQIGFWFTPIVYPLSIIPERYQGLLALNPMYPIVRSYQDILVYGKAPELADVFVIVAVSALLMVGGFVLFMRANEEMADVL